MLCHTSYFHVPFGSMPFQRFAATNTVAKASAVGFVRTRSRLAASVVAFPGPLPALISVFALDEVPVSRTAAVVPPCREQAALCPLARSCVASGLGLCQAGRSSGPVLWPKQALTKPGCSPPDTPLSEAFGLTRCHSPSLLQRTFHSVPVFQLLWVFSNVYTSFLHCR